MPYTQIHGRRPFERASKIGHTQIINSELVKSFLDGCSLPEPPSEESLSDLLEALPDGTGAIKTVIAIDGGLTETYIRPEFPSASIAFMNFGPLLLKLAHLKDLDRLTFIGPDDMRALKEVHRYTLVLPTRAVLARGAQTFSVGVRRSVHEFLASGDGRLLSALAWLLFREWKKPDERETWAVPRCPDPSCSGGKLVFRSGGPDVQECGSCGTAVYLADCLRLYERIDDEQGAGGILGYLLTALEQLVLVHLIMFLWKNVPEMLGEVLFVKDGPLAFFGVTAPLSRPMRELMDALKDSSGASVIHLVGVEKSGPFVEHAALIEKRLGDLSVLVLNNEYIYRYIVPGDSAAKVFGANTYYGAKVVFRGDSQDTYVATLPTARHDGGPSLEDLYNAGEVLQVVRKLRCSMYDNALIPVVLANHLVSLSDVPSSEILAKFAKKTMAGP